MKAADIPVAEPIIYNTDRMDQNTKRAGTQVDWKDMKIPRAKGGSLRNFLEDAEPNNGDPDQRLHEPQVEEWDAGEENEKPTKTHIPTEEEKQRRNESESEEETDPEGDEPEDATGAMDALKEFVRTLIASDANVAEDVHGLLSSLMRDKARQRTDGRIVSSHRAKAVSYATDEALINQHLPANMLCQDAANKIYDRAYEKQTSPERHYWSGLVFYLKNQGDKRIKDCNPATLSTLISKTLGAN